MYKQKWSKSIAILLTFAMLFQILIPLSASGEYAPSNDSYFEDITNHWAKDIINDFYERGLTKGYSDRTFRPDDKITRAEFAIFLCRSFDLNGIFEGESFKDVLREDWFYNEVELVKELGYIIGYPGELFKPYNDLTREEAAVIIARFFQIPEDYQEPADSIFTDGDKISTWARRSVYFLRDKGIISGMPDGSFSPKKQFTRAESAKVIVETLKSDRTISPKLEDLVINHQTKDSSSTTPPVITSLEPASGLMGSVVTIKGKYFSVDKKDISVVFEGEKQGEMEAGVISVGDDEISVLVPGVQQENLKVTVLSDGLESNQKNFELLGISEAVGEDDLAAKTLDSIVSLLEATKHETQIGLTPFVDQAVGDELTLELDSMIGEINQSIQSLTQGKTQEEIKIINNILSSPSIQEQLASIKDAADLLSHSTTSEALGNIIKAKETLREVKNMLDNVAYVFTIARNTAGVLAAAAILYGDIATAATLTDIVVQLENILKYAINPAREIVGGILAILDMAPTRALEDSLVLYSYENDLGIDQYFKNLEVTYNSREPKAYFEEKVNKLFSTAVIIESDLNSMSNKEMVGQEASEYVEKFIDDYSALEKAKAAYDIAFGLRLSGAINGYTSKRETITSIKNYSENLVAIKPAIEEIKDFSKNKADYYATNVLTKNLTDPLQIALMKSMSLNKKIYEINQNDDLAQSNDGIKANEHYKVYMSTELLLNRSLADLDFGYFETVPLDNLVTGSWIVDTYPELGSLSSTILQLVRKVGKIEGYEIEAMKQNTIPLIDDLGCILVAQPYFFKGHVDYTSRDNDFLNVENILGATGNSTSDFADMSNPIASLITKMIMKLADDKMQELLKIDLTDVDVALKVTFFDNDGKERLTSDIIEWKWINGTQTIEGVEVTNKLMLKAKKPGEENIMITAVLVEGQDYEEQGKEAFSIKRKIKAVSGYQSEAPYINGPELSKITNLTSVGEGNTGDDNSGYIGDIIEIQGFGFSKLVNAFQNVFFGSKEVYNSTGVAHKWLQSDNEYTKFKVEIPDSVTGELIVSVGPDGGSRLKWPSNPIPYQINAPRIDYANPTAIKGESWPVWGRGFSHTASYNKGKWTGADSYVIKPPSLTKPMDLFSNYDDVITQNNHDTHHSLHSRVDFIVPNDANSGAFHINTIGTLDTRNQNVTVRDFSENVVISSLERSGLRPSIARDNTTNKRIAVWIDQNETFNNKLVASLIDENGNTSNPVIISDNLGGIPTSPEPPSVSAENGIFKTVWTGLENDNDEVYFSYSQDGLIWSQPIKISNTPNAASLQPVVKAHDIDNDGDADAIVAWREDDGLISHIYSRILVNNNNSYNMGVVSAVSEGKLAYDPEIAVGDNQIAYIWAEDKEILLKEFNYNQDKYSNSVNVSENSSLSSGNPSAVYIEDVGLDKKSWAVVWEQLGKNDLGDGRLDDYKEEIYFANVNIKSNQSVNRALTIENKQNLTNSNQHSQNPVIDKDANNNLAIAWVEQGYEQEVTNQTEKYKSEVVFTRSFNRGQEFNRPYMRIQNFNNSTRLGHIDLISDKDALISIVWQSDENEHRKIYFTTTEGVAKSPNDHIANNEIGKPVNYILMEKENKFLLADSQGRPLRTSINSFRGDFSPSGKYFAFANGWVYESEADGSHPLAIYRAFNDNAVDVYWSPDEDILSANFVEHGFLIFSREGLCKLDNAILTGTQFVGSAVFNNPWFGDKAISNVIKMDWVERTDNNGNKYLTNAITDAYINVFSEFGSKIQRFGENGDTFAVFSPDGSKIALIKHENNDKILEQSYNPLYRFKGKLFTASSGGGYDNPLTQEYTASSPSWSPNSEDIVFISNEDSGKYVMIAHPYKQPSNPVKLTDEIKDAEIVVFSIDGEAVYVSRQQGYAKIDVKTGEVIEISGFPCAYGKINMPTGKLDISENNLLIEEGEKEIISIKLTKKPDSLVTVKMVNDDENDILVSPNTLTFDENNWDVNQVVEIQAVDNNIYTGTVQRAIGFNISSQDSYYNNYINDNIYIAVLENEPDPGDITPPVWTNGNIELGDKGTTWIEISWSGASDNIGIDNYKVYIDNVLKKTVDQERAFISGLSRNTDYQVRVEAVDYSGNETVTGPQKNLKTLEKDLFYAGEFYDKGGMQKGDGQPVAYGWTRQSTYSKPNGSGLKWVYKPTDSLWTISPPVIGKDGTVYYTGKEDSNNDWHLYAVNSDGTLKFDKILAQGMEGMQAAPHLSQNDEIIVVGKEKVFFLDNKGDAKWTFETDGSYTSPSGTPINGDKLIPASVSIATDGTVYIAATNSSLKRLMLYSVKNGQKIWKYQSNMYSDSTINYLGSMFTTPVPLDNGDILFGREVVQVVNSQGYLKYKFEPEDIMVNTTPVIGPQGYVYMALPGQYGGLYCLNMEADGLEKVVFKKEMGISGEGIAIGSDGTAYVGTDNGCLLNAVDHSGNLKWQFAGTGKLVGAPLVDVDGNIYFTTDKNKIYAVNRSGALLWVHDTVPEEMINGQIGMPALDGNNNLYFTTTNGLYALGIEKSSEISFKEANYTFNENDGNVEVKIVRNNGNGACVVYFEVDEQSTLLSNEYAVTSSEAYFKNGETEKTLSLSLNDDDIEDGNKKLMLSIIKIIGGEKNGNYLTTEIDIIDNEQSDSISIEKQTYKVKEDAGKIDIKVIRTFGGSSAPIITVDYQTSDGTAKSTVNYTATSGTLEFGSNEREKIVSVPIINNSSFEGNKNFSFILKNVTTSAAIDTTNATITIEDDEAAPEIEFELTEKTVDEGVGKITITVEREGDLTDVSNVFVEFNSGLSSATNESDFSKFSGVAIEFKAGESQKTFDITIIDDTNEETSEVIILDLNNPQGATLNLNYRMTITITDNEQTIPVPVAEAGWEGGYGHISLSNLTPGAKIRLYKNDGTLQRDPFNIGSPTYRINSVPVDDGYYVTQEFGGVESGASNLVNVVAPPPKVGSITSTSHYLLAGSETLTTKLLISGMETTHVYYFVVTGDNIEEPEEGANLSSVKEAYTWVKVTSEEINNIPANMGESMYIIEAEGEDNEDEVVGFSIIMIGYNEIKQP